MMEHKNVLLVPPRLYAMLMKMNYMSPNIYVRDNEMLYCDTDGHIHTFTYNGRLIDQPPPEETPCP